MCKSDLDNKIRECGAAYGMDIYSDRELLAVATGINLDKLTGTIQDILDVPSKLPGISRRKETAICAVKELVKRLMKTEARKIDVVHGPSDAVRFSKSHFWHENKEHFAILMLNTKNHIIGIQDVSVGNLTSSIVHPREVFETAIMHHSASIILLHNHPSGDPSPSREDISITHRLVEAGELMDIPVLDHIILGGEAFRSLNEEGFMNGGATI